MANGIDTRNLIDELNDLEMRRDDEEQDDPLNEDEFTRLTAIHNLINEVGDEASDGVYLVPESEFTEYAQELAEEIGAISSDASWPNNHIDWEAAANSLKSDYSSITFEGVDYLYR